jgi:hypothetical protein
MMITSDTFRDIFLGCLLVAGFSLVALVVIPAAVPVPKSIKVAALSPDFWPRVIAAGLAVMGAVLMLQGLIRWIRERHRAKPKRESREQVKGKRSSFARTAGIMAGLVVYYGLVQPLGIVVSSMLALSGFALIYGERRLKILFPLTVLLPIGLYYFFVKVANIPMPLGLFN